MSVRGSETRVTIGLEPTYGNGVKANAVYPLDFAGLDLPKNLGITDSKSHRGLAEAAMYTVTSERYDGSMPFEAYPEKGLAEILLAACGQVCTILGKYHERELVGYSNGVTTAFTPANTRKEEGNILTAAKPADDLSATQQPANNVRLRFKFVADDADIAGTLSITGTMNGKATQTEVIDIAISAGDTEYFITTGFFSAIDASGIDCLSCNDGTTPLVSATECRTRMFTNLSESNPTLYVATGTGAVTYATAPTAAELMAAIKPADDLSLATQPSVNSRLVIKVIADDQAVAGNVYITGTRNGVVTTQETVAVDQLLGTTAYYPTVGWYSAVDAAGVDAVEINDGTTPTITILQAQDVFAQYEEVVTGVYQHKFISNAGVDNRTLPSLIAYVDRQTRVDKVTGLNINSFGLTGASDTVLDAAVGLVAQEKVSASITYPTGLTYGQTSAGLSLHPFEFDMITWKVIDYSRQRQWVQDYEIESLAFAIENNGEGTSTADGSRNIRKFSPGMRNVAITFGLQQESDKWFDRYEDVQEMLFWLSCPTDQLIGATAEYYRIDIYTYKTILRSDNDNIGGAADLIMDDMETGNYVDVDNEGQAFAVVLTNAQSSVASNT